MTSLLSAFVLLLAALPAAGQTATAQHFSIVAKRFSFTPNEITVKVGQPVILELESLDVTHGLQIKEFHIKVTIHKGKITTVEFTPTEVGSFSGKCSHFCGLGHGHMKMVIDVVPK